MTHKWQLYIGNGGNVTPVTLGIIIFHELNTIISNIVIKLLDGNDVEALHV